jgi:polyisoprenoid-binding protein YceI
MKKAWLILLFFLPLAGVFAQYKPVDKASKIEFRIKNFGFGITGSIGGIEGEVVFSPDKPEAASFSVTVKSTTINTDNDMRDSHLAAEEYFDTKNFPLIRFVSESVKKGRKEGSYILFGKLTIKNHSQDISFPFTAAPSGKGYLFTGSFKMNRKDFSIGGPSTISNELEVLLSVAVE